MDAALFSPYFVNTTFRILCWEVKKLYRVWSSNGNLFSWTRQIFQGVAAVILGAVILVGSKMGGLELIGGLNPRVPGSSSNLTGRTEILGRSILNRVTSNLAQAGINAVSVISNSALPSRLDISKDCPVDISYFRHFSELYDVTEKRVQDQIEQGANIVLLINLDAYLEFDFADVLEFHRDRGQVVTRLRDEDGPLNFWVIDGARARKNNLSTAALLRGGVPSRQQYRLRGYSNRLQGPHDVRQLVSDAFYSNCVLRPSGNQIKPGVWIDEGAAVDRLARLVAPVYIGRNTQVRSGAIVTRASNVEHGCTVGCGTIVENASILANTYLGQGLDISHAVVDGGQFMHLKRNVTVSIVDPSLIASTALPVSDGGMWEPIAVPVEPGGGLYGPTTQVA